MSNLIPNFPDQYKRRSSGAERHAMGVGTTLTCDVCEQRGFVLTEFEHRDGDWEKDIWACLDCTIVALRVQREVECLSL